MQTYQSCMLILIFITDVTLTLISLNSSHSLSGNFILLFASITLGLLDNSPIGGFVIFSSQLVLANTIFCKKYNKYFSSTKWPVCADVPLHHIQIKFITLIAEDSSLFAQGAGAVVQR